MKRISLLLTSLLLSVATSFAQTVATGDTGACTWTLTGPEDNYTLTLSGSGAMEDYVGGDQPWYSYLSSIKQVIIENDVTGIGNYAFHNCRGLISVAIPNSVESIGNSAFQGCTGLSEAIIGNSVTGIGNYAFSGCRGLTSVAIPSSVTRIGNRAFSACSSLTTIVAENNTAYSSENGILFNKTKTTLVCYPGGRAGAYSIPNNVTDIGLGAFSDCVDLTSVTIHNGVTSIGNYAFHGCLGLTSITIPNSVESLGSDVFSYCVGLTEAAIPNSVTRIEDYTFRSCSSLTSVTIPSSVTDIGSRAFSYCNALTSVTNLNPTPQSITSDAFYEVDLSRATLYVPAESIADYQAASGWQGFGTITAYVPAAIDAPAGESDLWVSPNPVRDSFQIKGLAAPAPVAVTDISGKIVWKQTLTGSESIPASAWPAGVYLLRVQGQTLKVVKN